MKGGFSWRKGDFRIVDAVPVSSADSDMSNRVVQRLTAKPSPTEVTRFLKYQESKSEWYSPLDVVGLHRRFLDVWPDENGILAFSRQYGMLRGLSRAVEVTGRARLPQADLQRCRIGGETLDAWQRCHALLSTAITLYDARNDPEKLDTFAAWYREDRDSCTFWPADCPGAPAMVWPRSPGKWLPGRLRTRHQRMGRMAEFWVAARIEDCLWHEASVSLVYSHSGDPKDGAHQTSGFWAYAYRPASLWGALWIHFADELTGRATFQRCAGCEKWFLKDGGIRGRKSHATLCGDPSCKVRAYRKRQRLLRNNVRRRK